MQLKIDFRLLLGADIPEVPEPVIKEGFVNKDSHSGPPPGPPPGEEKKVMKIPQSILIYEEDSVLKGKYTHPRWGELEAIDINYSENNFLSFAAPSGNDDKNGATAYFNFVFAFNEATDNVVGFCGGRTPFFRSFLPIEGNIVAKR